MCLSQPDWWADLLATAGADRVLTLDLHADQIGGFFSMPSDHLTGMPLLTDYFAGLGIEDLVVVGDTGRIKAASECARRLRTQLAVLDKFRDPITSDVTIRGLAGDVRGRTVLYVEDEVVTGPVHSRGPARSPAPQPQGHLRRLCAPGFHRRGLRTNRGLSG